MLEDKGVTRDHADLVESKTVQRLTYDGYVAHHKAYMAKVIQDVVPTCFENAVRNVHWDDAMNEEMAALELNDTWELVPLPNGKKAIGYKWVYKVMHKADGNIERYKARLVGKGYAQTYGIEQWLHLEDGLCIRWM